MLTKPRDPSKMLQDSMYSHRKQRRSPLLLVGISVTVIIALIVVGATVVLPRLSASHAATTNVNCTLTVPNNPLSAQGLATPYQLTATDAAAGPCNEANTAQSAFVQADILDTATGQITVYEPLVIDQGTKAAVQPTAPQLPANAVVSIWFGFNATILTLQNNARTKGHGGRNFGKLGMRGGTNGNCVNGTAGSPFGQFAYCNAVNFFKSANTAIQAGLLKVPAVGTATDGKACMTTRDFGLVDMDQSDNVQTQYLVNANGQTAQLSAANKALLPNATTIGNPSDNALLTRFVDPALGCTPWTVTDLVNPGTPVSTYGTDELMAAADQQAPIALVPAGDEMVLVNNNPSLQKTNLYRMGADQTPAATLNDASSTTYCQNLVNTGLARLQLDMTIEKNATSPDGGATTNSLFTFLANRMNATFGAGGLNCVGLLNIQNPITLTTTNNIVTAATITNPPLAAGTTTGTTTTTTNTATGTVNATLDANAGTAQVTLNLTIANFANQQFFVNVTNSATGTQLLHQSENTDANGANTATTTINGLQGVTTIPNTWVASVTDANGNTLGSANFVSSGTTAIATLTATSTGTTTSTAATATSATATAGTTTGTTTTATNTATGTVNATLDANAGTAQVTLNLTIANFASQQFFVNVTDSATGTQLLHQTENTDANGANTATTTINGLQGVTTIPNTWVASVTDANGNTLGSANFVSNGTTAVATLTATSTGTTTTSTAATSTAATATATTTGTTAMATATTTGTTAMATATTTTGTTTGNGNGNGHKHHHH